MFGKTTLLALVATLGYTAAECPNACGGHGQCGAHDMCTCDINWQGADCSQRTCPFGRAHVDSPKGDLNFDNAVGYGATVTAYGYPSGTYEQYPVNLENESAHDYMECSNKGLCDRKLGECDCLPGYEGHACQRAACPNSCSGNGTCQTIKSLANLDGGNIYELWDKDSTMGCKCDAGYSGSDCSARQCPYGVDVLYSDDANYRVTKTQIKIQATSDDDLAGTFQVKFYDVHGQDYITGPITAYTEVASNTPCTKMTDALKALPNKVVPAVTCAETSITNGSSHKLGIQYDLTFSSNPGKLKQLEILTATTYGATGFTAGTAPSATVSTVEAGEFTDYFATKCTGLSVKLLTNNDSGGTVTNIDATVKPAGQVYMWGDSAVLSATEQKTLKKCLGDANGNTSDNVDVEDWDKGFVKTTIGATPDYKHFMGSHPHAIKLVDQAATNKYEGVSYHILWYDPDATGYEYRVSNAGDQLVGASDAGIKKYSLFTTSGVLTQLAIESLGSDTVLTNEQKSEDRVTGYWAEGENKVYTSIDVSCETDAAAVHKCVEKGDMLMIVNSCWGKEDAGGATGHLNFGATTVTNTNCGTTVADIPTNAANFHTVTKIYKNPIAATSTELYTFAVDASSDATLKRYTDTFVIELDASIAWEGIKGNPENTGVDNAGTVAATTSATWSDNSGIVVLFHFKPASDGAGQYEFVSQCSGRGTCDATSGLCQCFKGYWGDACTKQSVLAV
jgi:hypothetical protein